jgi:hypothetical protein
VAETAVTIILRARDEASGALKNVSGEFGAIALSAGAMIALSAGVAGALATIATSAGREADDLRVLGIQSGQTTEDISRLKFASDQLDTSLPAVASSIKIMNRSLFEARDPGSEARKTLVDIGFAAKDLDKGLGPPSEAFLKIVDRLNAVEDPGVRAALALKVFGRGAAEILPLINAGSAEIREMEERSDALGATISNTAGVVGDEYGDAMKEARAVTAGLKAEIATELLPELTQLIHGFTDAAAALRHYQQEHPQASRAISDTATQITGLGIAVTAFLAIVPLLRAGLAAIGVDLVALSAAGGPITLAILGFTALLFVINKVRADAGKALEVKVVTNAKEAEAELERLVAARGEQVRRLRDAEKRVDANAGAGSAPSGAPLSPKQQALVDAERDAQDAAAQVAKFDESIAKAGAQLRQFDKDGQGAWASTTDGAKAGTSALADFLKMLEEVKAGIGELSKDDIKKALALPTEVRKPDLSVPGQNAPSFGPPDPNEIRDLRGRKTAPLEIDTKELADVVTPLQRAEQEAENFKTTLADAIAQFSPINDVGRALVEAAGQADAAWKDMFTNIFVRGQNVFASLGQFMKSALGIVGQLISEIVAAIAKAAVLSAILPGKQSFFKVLGSIFGLEKGGPVAEQRRGAGGPITASGGGSIAARGLVATLARIPGYAMGGPVRAIRDAAAMVFPVHAAAGLALPGGPSFTDNIPAMLAGGEFVVANSGASTGTNITAGLVRGLDTLRDVMAQVRQGSTRTPRGGPATIVYQVQTISADGLRAFARGGDYAQEFALAADPARG